MFSNYIIYLILWVVLFISPNINAQDILVGDANQTEESLHSSIYKFGMGKDTSSMRIGYISYLASKVYFYLPPKYHTIEKGSKIIIQFADSTQYVIYNNMKSNNEGVASIYYGDTYGQIGLQWVFFDHGEVKSITFITANGTITLLFTDIQGFSFLTRHFFLLMQFSSLMNDTNIVDYNKKLVSVYYDTTYQNVFYQSKDSIQLKSNDNNFKHVANIKLKTSKTYSRTLPIEIYIYSNIVRYVNYGTPVLFYFQNGDSIKCYSQNFKNNLDKYRIEFTQLDEDLSNLKKLTTENITGIRLYAEDKHYDLTIDKKNARLLRQTITEFNKIKAT